MLISVPPKFPAQDTYKPSHYDKCISILSVAAVRAYGVVKVTFKALYSPYVFDMIFYSKFVVVNIPVIISILCLANKTAVVPSSQTSNVIQYKPGTSLLNP